MIVAGRLSVRDHKHDFAPIALAVSEICSGSEDRIIQDLAWLRREVYDHTDLSGRDNGCAIDNRAGNRERTSRQSLARRGIRFDVAKRVHRRLDTLCVLRK